MNRICACLAIVLIGTGAACDPNAKASANDRLAATQERMSRQYESCSSTLECAEGLRCFQQVCRRTEASLLGDYHSAAGARALAEGNPQKAVDAYTAAINRYTSDKVEVPMSLYCAKGRALVALRQDRDKAEQSARALHSCLRGAPVGSRLREQALMDLAILGASGLDPELLSSESDMERYLTKQPARPALDSVTVKATGEARTKAGSYTEFLALLESDQLRDPLLTCWESNWKANKKKELSVTLELKHRFIQAEFVEDDRDKLTIESDEPAAGSPERCVHDAVAGVVDGFTQGKRTGQRWNGNITLRISQ